MYEDYLYCCRDGVATRKRSLDPLKAKHEEQALKREVEERTKLLRADAALYQPFKQVPEAAAWLATFQTHEPPFHRSRVLCLVAFYTQAVEILAMQGKWAVYSRCDPICWRASPRTELTKLTHHSDESSLDLYVPFLRSLM